MNHPAESPSWLWVASALSFLAGLGGIVVLRGLWMEGYRKHDTYSNIGEFRAQHTRESNGIKLVFWGVLIEVIVAFTMTFREAWEAHRTDLAIRNISPLNQPVSEISAVVSFTVKEDTPSETPNWGMSRVAGVMLCESNFIGGNTNFSGFRAMSTLNMLEADKFDRYFDGKTLQYVMNFHTEGWGEVLMHDMGGINDKTAGWVLKHVRYLDITTKFLPHDAAILGGSAVLTVNSGPQKWFYIPPQNDPEPTSGKAGYGYEVIASESPTEHVHGGLVALKAKPN